VECSSLCKTREFAEGYLGEVLGEGVDRDRAALSRWRDRREMVAASVPADDLDSRPDGDANQHALILQLGAGTSPFTGGFFTGWDGVLLSICGISEARRQDIPTCLVEGRCETGVCGDHKEDILANSSRENERIFVWSPTNSVYGLLTA